MADDTQKAPASAGDLELAKLKQEPSSSSIDPKNRSDSFLKKKEKKDKEKEEDNHHLKAAKSQANQAKILRENRFFAAARSGTVYDFKDAVGDPKKPRVDITARGAFGETVLHIACLFANFPVMRYIVENFPQLTNLTYENQPYLGETALHICLVQADVDAVEFLLDHGANVNDCNCNGDFFKPKPPVGKIYMGEHPLTFAACVESEKSKEMIRLLIKHGARFDNVDDYGNNILHVLVIKDKPEMYDYIMDLYDLYKKPDWVNIEEMTNKQMRTPLGLASALAKGEMFETILRRRKETLWIYGPIAQSAYPLKEVDTYRGPVRRPPTALELVVYLSGEAGVTEENYLDRCDLLTKMPMKELVDSKWSIFAKRFFYGYFLFYIAYLVIFTLAVARFSFLLEADGATPNRAMAGLEITVLVFVALFIAMEIYDLIFLRLRYFTEKGSNFFFGITWINAAFIYLAFFLRMSEDSYPNLNVKLAEEICTAFAAFFSWFYLLYFFRGWKSLGFFAIAIREILANDIVKFAIIYLILSTGFALVFMVMFRDSGLPGFTNLGWAMFSMFNLLTGDGSSIDPSQAHSAGFTQFAQAIYTILMAILLLNMLIAMMGGTYSSITEKSEKQHVLERVSLILFIERRFIFPIQYLKNLYRSGQPAADAGLAGTDYYLLLQEKTNWGASAASGRRKFVFKNAVKKVISALRMRKNINKDPSKRESMIAIQKRREEELERLRKRKEEEAKKKAEKEKEKDFLDIPGMFNEMGEFVDEMAFIGYEGDEQIGGAN